MWRAVNSDLASTWLINVALFFANHDLASQFRVNGYLSNVFFYSVQCCCIIYDVYE